MKTFTIEEAKANFEALIELSLKGRSIVVVDDDNRELELRLKPLPPNRPRQPGSAIGRVKLADDFEAPSPELKPYM